MEVWHHLFLLKTLKFDGRLIEMDKIDYIVLDYASEFKVMMGALFKENAHINFNKPRIGESCADLSKRLINLFDKGLIMPFGVDKNFDFVSELNKSSKDESSGNIKNPIFWGLTAKGGALWEDIFKPNWHLFLSVEWSDSENNPSNWYGKFEAANFAGLEKFFLFWERSLQFQKKLCVLGCQCIGSF